MSFIKKVSNRYLWSKRSEAFISILTFISILGVAIGVAVLASVMSVMTGFETELKEKIIGATSHVTIKSSTSRINNWEKLEPIIKSDIGVQEVSPYSYHQALIRSGYASQGLLVRGITENSFGSTHLASTLTSGDVKNLFVENKSNEVSLPGIILGLELMKRLQLQVGDIISLLSPQVSSSPFGLIPSYKRFVVTGVYKGLLEYEQAVGFISLTAAQKLFNEGNQIYGFDIQVENMDDAPMVAKRILDATENIDPRLISEDWTITNKPLWDAIRLEKKVYFIVLLLIVVMASFSIVSTLVMIVLEKRRDIGVLMTLGSDPKSIQSIFLRMGAKIGLIGTILGLILGVIICLSLQEFGFPLDEKIFGMSQLPIAMKPINFIVIGISSFLICVLATLYPSRRASMIEPCEVLKT